MLLSAFGANSCKKSSSFWVEHISNAIFMLLRLILPHRIIIYAGSNSMTWRIKSVSFCRFAQKAVLQNAMECPPPLAVHSNLIIQTTSWLLQFSCKLLVYSEISVNLILWKNRLPLNELISTVSFALTTRPFSLFFDVKKTDFAPVVLVQLAAVARCWCCWLTCHNK